MGETTQMGPRGLNSSEENHPGPVRSGAEYRYSSVLDFMSWKSWTLFFTFSF